MTVLCSFLTPLPFSFLLCKTENARFVVLLAARLVGDQALGITATTVLATR